MRRILTRVDGERELRRGDLAEVVRGLAVVLAGVERLHLEEHELLALLLEVRGLAGHELRVLEPLDLCWGLRLHGALDRVRLVGLQPDVLRLVLQFGREVYREIRWS